MKSTVVLNAIDMLRKANSAWRIFRCPYCGGDILPYSVAFRAKSHFSKEEGAELSEEKRKFIEREDVRLKHYYDSMMTRPEYDVDDKNVVLHPVMVDCDEVKCNTFVIDEDEFPYAMIDSLGAETKKRLCPHCHNRLADYYGKYPVYSIAVVGNAATGKTVFLSQLLKKLDLILPSVGMVRIGGTDEIDKYVEENCVEVNKTLPAATVVSNIKPLTVNIKSIETGKVYSLVFYDWAGEVVTSMQDLKNYKMKVTNSDAFIYLMDPVKNGTQVDNMENNDSRFVKTLENIINACYLETGVSMEKKINKPFAITVSKKDRAGLGFEGMEACNDKSNTEGKGIDLQIRHDNNEIIKKFLGDNEIFESLFSLSDAMLEYSNYFAVSSLGSFTDCDESCVLKAEAEPQNIEEPLLWILYKLGIIPEAKIEEVKKGSLFKRHIEKQIVTKFDEKCVETCYGGMKLE